MGYVVRWNGTKWVVKAGRSKFAPVVRSYARRRDALKYKWLMATPSTKNATRRRTNR